MQTVAVYGKFEFLARLGYLARAVVYLIIGILAAMTAFGEGGQTTGSQGALAQLAAQPFGNVLLFVVAIGLLGYSAWRATQAFGDTLSYSTEKKAKDVAKRIGWAASSLTHLALALWAFGVVFGMAGGGSGGDWTARVLSKSWGPWLVAAVGAGTIIAGLNMIYRGWTAKFEEFMHIPYDKRDVLHPTCRFGLVARGVVFLLLGWFIIQAAMGQSSGQDVGIGKALATLQQQPYGQWLLGAVALGLIAFGVYSAIEAKYRRFDT